MADMTVLDGDAAIILLDTALRAGCAHDDRIFRDRDAAGRLANACGGLSLSLQIAAALLQTDPGFSADDLAKQLNVEQEQLRSLHQDDGTEPGRIPVSAALEISYSRLEETAARVFRLLPVNPGPDVSTAAVAVLADLPVSEAGRVLEGLARAHLVDAAPGGERWHMRDLVRLYAQNVADTYAEADRREHARDQLLGYYMSMVEAAGNLLQAQPETVVSQEFADRDGALTWLDGERANLDAAVQMAAETGRDQAAMSISLLLAQYLASRRQFNDLLATTAIGLDAARRLGDRRHEGDALTNLGGALQEVRRFDEAVAADQDAAAIYREIGYRRGEGAALNNLGLALKAMRRFDEAIAAHQDAAAIYREIGYRRGEGMALGNLGGVLRGAGRSDESIDAWRGTAAIFRETGDQYGRGVALSNLGEGLAEIGRFDEAIAAYQDAAIIFRETGDQDYESIALENLEKARVSRLS
jgi:tetratricopeptide (TPR) repeat protein